MLNVKLPYICLLLLLSLVGFAIVSFGVYRPDRYGLEGKYFNNMDWQGTPLIVSLDKDISSETLARHRKDLPHNRYSVEWTGYIDVPETDLYTFFLDSDDGSWLFIDEQLVVDNGGMHGLIEKEGKLHLQRGVHRTTIRYFQAGGYAALRLFWSKEEQAKMPLSNAYLLPAHTSKLYRIGRNSLPFIIALMGGVIILTGYAVLSNIQELTRRQNLALSLIIGGVLVSFVCSRAGKYFINYAIIGEDGSILTPFIQFGLALVYCLVPLALLVFFVLSSSMKRRWLVKYQFKARMSFVAPVSFKELIPLLIIAMGMNGFLFINNPNFGADSSSYIFPVHGFMQGEGYTGFLPPGYGILSYGLFLITNNIEVAAMLVASFSYVLTVVVGYYIGRILAGKFAGFLAAFFITFCPLIIRYSFVSMITVCYIFLAVLSFLVYLNVILHKPDYFRSILLGAILGYTVFTREEGLVLAVGAMAFLLILLMMTLLKGKLWRFGSIWKLLSYPTATLFITAIFIFIQIYSVYSNTGSWVISGRLKKVTEGINNKYRDGNAKLVVTESVSDKNNGKSDQSVSMLDFRPVPLKPFVSRVELAVRQLMIHISSHAFIPLVGIMCIGLLYLLVSLLTKNRFLFNWRITGKHAKIGGAFLIFTSPIIAPIAVNNLKIRYILMHSAFLLILIAVIIVKLLTLLSKKYAVLGIILVCIVSFLLVSGGLEESILVKNRFLSAGFKLTKQSLHNLRNDGLPEEIAEHLKPVKWRKFAWKKELREAVEQQIGKAPTEKYWQQILNSALISPIPSHSTLPGTFQWRTIYVGLRAAGLWLAHYYPGNLDHIKVMVGRGPLVLFYATGRDEVPKGSVVGLPKDLALAAIAEKMKQEHIEYLILDNGYAKNMKNMAPLWEKPELAREFGLKLVQKDPEGLFQVYSVEQ